jgi:TIR domain/HEAT repeats
VVAQGAAVPAAGLEMGQPVAWKVFYSYSHEDSNLRHELATHLALLKHDNRIVEWYDQKIEPGANWAKHISDQLDSADLILLLISPDFLASDYCFGVEADKALTRLKDGDVKVVPILLRPCMWDESRFSQLQIIPRGATPITSWANRDEALSEVAKEIRDIVKETPPSLSKPSPRKTRQFDSSFELVHSQVRAYANLYERTRQRVHPSVVGRQALLQRIFDKMSYLATASYPLLDELAKSPSPGERVAAIAILQVFASEQYLKFLVSLVGSEKPFVDYQATKALHFAAEHLAPDAYPQLLEEICKAKAALELAHRLNADRVGDITDRLKELQAAEDKVRESIKLLAVPPLWND